MNRRPEGVNGMKNRSQVRGTRALAALLASAGLLGFLGGQGCSNASRTLKYSSPSPDPGVIYVAEQVFGLDDWARASDARSYAPVTTRNGEAEEGPLVRITGQTVVMAGRERTEPEVTIDKDEILFMRVWW